MKTLRALVAAGAVLASVSGAHACFLPLLPIIKLPICLPPIVIKPCPIIPILPICPIIPICPIFPVHSCCW